MEQKEKCRKKSHQPTNKENDRKKTTEMRAKTNNEKKYQFECAFNAWHSLRRSRSIRTLFAKNPPHEFIISSRRQLQSFLSWTFSSYNNCISLHNVHLMRSMAASKPQCFNLYAVWVVVA